MKDWVLIAVGLGCLVVLGLLAHGCREGGGGGEARVPLSPAAESAVEAAARAVAAAASAGDTATLDAAITAGLPEREMHTIRAALAGLRGRPPLTVRRVEGVAGGALVTLEGEGGTRTWHFDRTADGTWTLSGV